MNTYVIKKNHSELLTKVMVFSMLLSSIVSVYASDSGIFAGAGAASGSVLEELVTLYSSTMCPVLVIITLIAGAVGANNEKIVEITKKAFKIEIGVYIILNCITLVFNTVDWLIGLLVQGAGAGA